MNPQNITVNILPVKIAATNFLFGTRANPPNMFIKHDGVNGKVINNTNSEKVIFLHTEL